MNVLYAVAAAAMLLSPNGVRAGISQNESAASIPVTEIVQGVKPSTASASRTNTAGLSGSNGQNRGHIQTIDLLHTSPRSSADFRTTALATTTLTTAAATARSANTSNAFFRREQSPGMSTFSLAADGSSGRAVRAGLRADGPATAVVALPPSAPIGFFTLIVIAALTAARRILRRLA